MSKAQVLQIQGAPLIMEQREWSYGVSKVYFSGGTVTGWYNARATPLRANPSTYGWVGERER